MPAKSAHLTGILQSFRKQGGGSISLISAHIPGIAVIEISNSNSKNAISPHMMTDLHDCVNELESLENINAVVLYGSGGTFCSGFDLKMTGHSDYKSRSFAESMSTLMQDSLTRLSNLPIISVAAIDGYAVGGGAEIVTACDFRVASDEATIAFVHSRMGLFFRSDLTQRGVTTGWGGASRLLKILPTNMALRYLASGQSIDVATALRIGLLDKLASPNQTGFDCSIDFLTREVFKDHNSKKSVRGFKQIIARSRVDQELLDYERQIFCNLWGARDNLSALASMIKARGK